jgi:hypothetical protein
MDEVGTPPTAMDPDLVFWLTLVIVVQTFALIWLAVPSREASTRHPPPAPAAEDRTNKEQNRK